MRNLNVKKTCSMLILSLCLISNGGLAASLDKKIKYCALIERSDDRFVCYEKLGAAVLGERGRIQSSSALKKIDKTQQTNALLFGDESIRESAESVGNERRVLPSDIGGDAFKSTAEAPIKNKPKRGRVVSCQKALDKRWFYIFENDQVWKQVDSDRRRHRQCNFYVSITKDRIGYKMQIDGENKLIRIKRQR